MHEQWEALIPFYVARTLPSEQAIALESHLATCETCRASLEQWRMIADATWNEAQNWSHTLPPLSPDTRSKVQASGQSRHNGQGQTTRIGSPVISPTVQNTPLRVEPPAPNLQRIEARVKRVPSRRFSLATMAAAVMFIFLFGGVLVFMAGRMNQPDTPATAELELTPVVMGSENGDFALDPGDELGYAARPQAEGDMGIITAPTLTPSPTFTPPPLPTQTPMIQEAGSGGRGGGIEGSTDFVPIPTFTPAADNPAMQSQLAPPTPASGCTARSATGESVIVRQMASEGAPVVGQMAPDETLRVLIQSGSGWYEIIRPEPRLWGWVNGRDVILEGGECGMLLLPSPTYTPTPLTPDSGDGGGQQTQGDTDIQAGAWQHTTTIIEHNCGGVVGERDVIDLTLAPNMDGSTIELTYNDSGTGVTLYRQDDGSYSASYHTSAQITVNLTFTSATTYTASERITHESGCIVRSEWRGEAQ